MWVLLMVILLIYCTALALIVVKSLYYRRKLQRRNLPDPHLMLINMSMLKGDHFAARFRDPNKSLYGLENCFGEMNQGEREVFNSVTGLSSDAYFHRAAWKNVVRYNKERQYQDDKSAALRRITGGEIE